MTSIAAIVDEDGTVWVGGDSAGVSSRYSLEVRNDPKVFINGPFIVGFTTSFRMGQLLHYSFVPPKHPKKMDIDSYMNTIFIDAVRKCMKAGGYSSVNNNTEEGGCFIVGYRGRLFIIDNDFQVGMPHAPYTAVGCGHDLCKGSLHATQGTNIESQTRVRMALEAAEQFSGGVRRPFVIRRKSLNRKTK